MPGAALDIPVSAPRVTATLEQTHVMFEGTPSTNPLFAYRLAIPKGWAYSAQFGPVPEGPFASQGLGFMTGSARSGAPVVAVTVTPIPFEIPIDVWVRSSMTAEGWTVVSARWFPGAKGLFFDITGTRTVNDVEEVRRTSVRADGIHVFSVNCLSAREHWDEAKEIFWVAHSTFQLVKPVGTTRMEPWLAASADRRPDFVIAYPMSWSASPVEKAPDGASGLDVRLLDAKQETLLAYLQVQAVALEEGEAVPSFDVLVAKAVKRLGSAGFKPAGPPKPTSAGDDPRAAAVDGWLGGLVGTGRLAEADVTARLGFVVRDRNVVTFLLFSPLLADDTLVALRAERAFEIARATFELG